MRKLPVLAVVTAFTLAACGSTDDANAPAEADTVEMPADEAMAAPGMDEDPAVDPALADEAVEPEPTSTPAEDAADAAAAAADDLSAAMAE